MNLLARILSHGFAFVVVALIIIVLMYRGDLFEESDLPDFLVIKDHSGATAESGTTGSVDRTAAVTIPSTTPQATPGTVPEAATVPPETEAPVVESETPAGPGATAEPDTATTMAEPVISAPVESSDTASEIKVAAEPEPAVNDTPALAPVAEETTASGADESSHEQPAAETMADADSSTMETAAATAADETAPAGQPAETGVDENHTAGEVTATVAESSPPADSSAMPDESLTATEAAATAAAEPAAVVTEAAVTESEASTEPAVAAETVTETETTVETAPQAAETPQESPYAVMAKAREAYWLRDFDTAEQQYRLLTEIDPDNPDSYGEMGNMYFSQGKWEQAATAYYESGTRLLKDGLVAQAKQMLEVIRGLNGSRADELEAQIKAAEAP